MDSATYALLWLADLDALLILVRAVDSGFSLAVKSPLRNDTLAMRGLKMWLSCSQAESAATVPDDPTESTDSPVTESSAADERSAASRQDSDQCCHEDRRTCPGLPHFPFLARPDARGSPERLLHGSVNLLVTPDHCGVATRSHESMSEPVDTQHPHARALG